MPFSFFIKNINNMRKPLFTILAVLAVLSMASCGNKTGNSNEVKADSLADSLAFHPTDTMQADGPEGIAPDDQWTEEAVAAQIKKIYADVSRAFTPSEDGLENNIDLDAMYCTQYWNETLQQVRAINAKKPLDQQRFYNDEIRWTYGLGTPLTPKNIKVELTTGNMATATFDLACGEQWMHTVLALDWEGDQWRINSWEEVGDNSQDLLIEMLEYVEKNHYCPLNISLMEKFRAETFFRCQPFWLPLLSPNKIKRNHGQKYTFFRTAGVWSADKIARS